MATSLSRFRPLQRDCRVVCRCLSSSRWQKTCLPRFVRPSRQCLAESRRSVKVMSGSTLISVIVAAHNEERYIGRCLRSLLAQTFPRTKFDIIVVDDGSTDRTAAVLQTFGNDVRVLRNDENIGLPA
ncbi:MAG: glycosyltransferase family 2 protein, partial [Actinobacteria bacterium]|nr:glycosyltransferase family 2 protein [Actinomycetota bacterium]